MSAGALVHKTTQPIFGKERKPKGMGMLTLLKYA